VTINGLLLSFFLDKKRNKKIKAAQNFGNNHDSIAIF